MKIINGFKMSFLIVLCLMIIMPIMPVSAYEGEEIPIEMPADTLIRYTSDTEYEIITDKEEKEALDFNKHDFNEVNCEVVNLPSEGYIVENYPNPKMGVLVQYGSDGQVNRIYSQKEMKLESRIKVEKPIETKGIGDPTYGLVATWGSYPNYLYKGYKNYPYKFYGRGRATVFADTIGQKDHKLVKGDVATSLKYDNCACNTEVMVAMNKASGGVYSKKMKKWDVGSLPNAIIDIWKTGVEDWGYKYSSTLSIGGVTINHN